MTKIYLIRHGETEWNKIGKLQGSSDIQLLPEGIKQAHMLADHAPFHAVDAIYSSDLSRAVMTAEILAEKFNLPVIIVADSGLGAINATVLTAAYLRAKNIPIKGIILNRFNEKCLVNVDNEKMIAELTDLPIIAKVPADASEIEIDLKDLLQPDA